MLESLPLLRALRHPWSTMTAAHHTADVWSHAIKWVQAISGQTAWNMHDGANKQTVETRVGRWLCPPSHLQKAGLAFVLHFLALLRSSANHPAGVIIPAFYWRHQEMDWGAHPTGDEGHCPSQSPMMCCHVFGGDTWVWSLYRKVSSGRSSGRCLLFRLKIDNAIIQVSVKRKICFQRKMTCHLYISPFFIPERPFPTMVLVYVRSVFWICSALSYSAQTEWGTS